MFAESIGITLACLRERDDSPGKDCIGVIAPLLFKGDAGHFERDAHEALGLGVEFMAVKEWRERHGALHFSGESATVSQLAGA